MDEDLARTVELLRLAARYIREGDDYERTIEYDNADCDGICLADDCDSQADTIEESYL